MGGIQDIRSVETLSIFSYPQSVPLEHKIMKHYDCQTETSSVEKIGEILNLIDSDFPGTDLVLNYKLRHELLGEDQEFEYNKLMII
jgi:hypothetical protein